MEDALAQHYESLINNLIYSFITVKTNKEKSIVLIDSLETGAQKRGNAVGAISFYEYTPWPNL